MYHLKDYTHFYSDTTRSILESSGPLSPNMKSPFVVIDRRLYSYDGMFSKVKTGTPDISEAITDDVQGRYGYFFFQKGKKVEVVMMSPDQYLMETRRQMRITQEEQSRWLLKSSQDKIKEAISEGHKIDMPYLDYRRGFGQEGRNRAVVAKERGELLIPVAVVTDVTFEDKVSKSDELVSLAMDEVGTDRVSIETYLKQELNLHMDAIRFIRENSGKMKSLES